MIRTLLVDDEPTARDRLRQLLGAFQDVEIVDEAEDGAQAIEKILEVRPDLVFLDVQMPECSGLEVVTSLSSPRPRIIFCTAYDQYAVDAFELHAVDYLLKPVSRARLAQALERVRGLEPRSQEAALEKASERARRLPSRFLAKKAGKFRVIFQQDVIYFASEEGLTQLHTGEQYYWMEPTLNDLENRLDPAAFCRISRAAIVNLDAIREVSPLTGGSGEVLMKNGVRLDVSRRRFRELIEKLTG